MNTTGDGLIWTIIIAAVVNLAATILTQAWNKRTGMELARREREDARNDKLIDAFVAIRATVERWERASSSMVSSLAAGRSAVDDYLESKGPNSELPGAVTITLVENISRLHLMVRDTAVKNSADQLLEMVTSKELTQPMGIMVKLLEEPFAARKQYALQAHAEIAKVVGKSRELLSYGENALGYELPLPPPQKRSS